MVGGLTPRARPAHTHGTVTSIRIAMDTHTPPRHYSLLHKRTLIESGSQLKACGGRGGRGLFKAKSVPARGCGPLPSSAAAHLDLSWPLRSKRRWLGCGEGLPLGRTSQTSCSQGQKISHGGGSDNVLCILCRHLAERRASAPHTGTQALSPAGTCSCSY